MVFSVTRNTLPSHNSAAISMYTRLLVARSLVHCQIRIQRRDRSCVRVGAVGSDQCRDQDSKVQDAEDRFEDRDGTCLRRDRGDSSRTERGHGAETVINEIEALGNGVKVGARIKIKGMWLEGGHHAVDTCKTKPHQQVDTEGSKDGFRFGLFLGEHVVENNHDNEYVKNKAQDHVEY